MRPLRRLFQTLRLQTFCLLFALFSLLCWTHTSAQEVVAVSQDDDEVIHVNTDLVVLNATVLDAKGKYVHGLGRSDFKVLEDGREQAISDFGVEETSFAVAVLMDTSGSMQDRMTLARSAAIRFLDGLRTDDVAAIYHFNTEVVQVQDFSPNRDLSPLIYGLRAGGMTALNEAILQAADALARRPEKRRAIVVLSDGYNEGSGTPASKALDRALAAGANIYTVNMASTEPGAAPLAGAAALKNFASKSGGRYVAISGGQGLRDAFAGIVEELSNQYTLSYRPSNRARDGRWRSIQVKLSAPKITVRARQGYRAPKA
ncbi:MAG TPA: VWA domain-containing protein [Pyrinomonadaceae bacterium]